MSEKLLCEIFKSSRKDEMYLYVDKRKGMETVPEALMETFGKPVPVLTMMLTADKPLARVKAADVMAAIEDFTYKCRLPKSPTYWTFIALRRQIARELSAH